MIAQVPTNLLRMVNHYSGSGSIRMNVWIRHVLMSGMMIAEYMGRLGLYINGEEVGLWNTHDCCKPVQKIVDSW